MRKTPTIVLLLLLLCYPLSVPVQAKNEIGTNDDILLAIPASVVHRIVAAVVPVQLNTESSILTGVITVEKLEDLKFTSQSIACQVTLSGKDIHLVTELLGNQIRVKVGNVSLELGCQAFVRFDEKKQTLFVKPVLNEVNTGSGEGGAELGQALTTLLDGREFPIKLNEIAPLVAEVSNKTISVHSHVKRVRVNSKGIMLNMIPVISEKK